MQAVLALDQISKSFPGVRALDRVGFDVRAGEVHALLGENGAGKSTLIKIISGLYQPDEGTIRLDGEIVRFANPHDAQRRGIATIFQELLLFPELTVAENIFMGHAPRTRFGGSTGRRCAPRRAHCSPRSTSTISIPRGWWARSRSATGSGSRSPRRSRRTPAS